MHASRFSYSVTRPYPFAWFTPVVLIGGTIALILFSILNLVSNGYYLQIQDATDPNKTVSENIWFKHWPSYLTSKVQPSCQTIGISSNAQFTTNQSGLTYTLTGVWQDGANGTTVLPSLTYQNNILSNCTVNAIEIDLESFDRLAMQIAYTQWGAQLYGYTTCSIATPSGTVSFNLTAGYNYIPESVSWDNSTLYTFLSPDKSHRASLWWGESLLSMYWIYLIWTLQQIRENVPNGSVPLRKGTLYFEPDVAGNQQDKAIMSLDFFNLFSRFLQDQPGQVIYPYYPSADPELSNSISALVAGNEYPNIWIPADSLAKSFYSAILTDLGQVSASPNVLTDTETLQAFTTNFSYILNYSQNANVRPGPALENYNTLGASTGPLGTTPSVIFDKYICQVPMLKSTGNIIVSVLIADLVFMQALWQLLKLATEYFFLNKKRMGSDVNYCEGCSRQSGGSTATLLESVPKRHDYVPVGVDP